MPTYSHSKLSAFEQCPMKYKFRYIDNILVLEKSIEAHLGKAVHSALEWLYFKVRQKTIPELDNLILYYTDIWQKEYDENIIIVNGTQEEHYNKGIQYLVDYYQKHHPFDDNTLETEKEISINLDDNEEYQLKGFIDRLAYNLQTGEYEIHDYKTANTLPSQEKIDTDRQLALYSLAIKKEFSKDKEVNLIWHYLAHNLKITSKRTNAQLEQLKNEVISLIKEIEQTETFLPCVSKLCSWCEYKSMCPAWNNSDFKGVQKKLEEF